MAASELDQLIQNLYKLNEHWHGKSFLRPPASRKEIAECERFLGRTFSSSYKHFLSLHNGWENYRGFLLMGTGDYHSEELNKEIALTLKGFLDGCGAPVDDLPERVFLMENLYRLVDASGPVAEQLESLKKFMDNFTEEDDLSCLGNSLMTLNTWLLLPKHTIIGIETPEGSGGLITNGAIFRSRTERC